MHLCKNWGLSVHKDNQPLIFEISKEGRVGYSLPELDIPEVDLSTSCLKAYFAKKQRTSGSI